MNLPPELWCPIHAEPLALPADVTRVEDASVLHCQHGCKFPVVNGIPRFVEPENYATSFGLQWNKFSRTQLDSYTGASISRERVARCLGGSIDVVREQSVLEVGCGAGRFTELLLDASAKVFACDLSSAVEANYANCHRWPNYFVCQADVGRLPTKDHSFDFVICLGVIQHTPNPEETMQALAKQVKPGGTLVIDHYSFSYPRNFIQRNLRKLLIKFPPRFATPAALGLARVLLPLHKCTWTNRRGTWRLRKHLLKHSPLIDYYEAYPQLGTKLLTEWSILDTHDSLTDYYKHLRSTDEIEAALRGSGLVDTEVTYGGNGVEARAKMPNAPAGARGNA